MRVGIVSNWNQVCGIAEYAKSLCAQLSKEYEVVPFTEPYTVNGVDVALVNWHPAVIELPPFYVKQMKAKGMKVIVVMHNSHGGYYTANEQSPLYWADATVVHQPMEGNIKLVHIPMGVPVVDQLRAPGAETWIGIAGFPYAWKRFNVVAEAARRLNGTALLIAPRHPHGDTTTPISNIQISYKNVVVQRDWTPVEEVVRSLSGCTLNIFWYQWAPSDDMQGQSGSVLMGVAAKRPMIVSRHPKLSEVAKHEKEVYVAETEEQVHEIAANIVSRIREGKDVKRPYELARMMSWDGVGLRYRSLIRMMTMMGAAA